MTDPPAYVCPVTRRPLTRAANALVAGDRSYPVVDGVPHLVPDAAPAPPAVAQNRRYYESVGATDDAGMDWLFRSFGEDEAAAATGTPLAAWLEDAVRARLGAAGRAA